MNIIDILIGKDEALQKELSGLKNAAPSGDSNSKIQAFLLRYKSQETLKNKMFFSKLGEFENSKQNKLLSSFLTGYDEIHRGKWQLIKQLQGVSGTGQTMSTGIALDNFTYFARSHFNYESQTIFPAIRKALRGETLVELGRQMDDLIPRVSQFVVEKVPQLVKTTRAIPTKLVSFWYSRPLSNSWKFSLVGLLLGFAFPLSIFFFHLWRTSSGGLTQYFLFEWTHYKMVYILTGCASMSAFPIFGYLLGLKNDRLKRRFDSLEKTADDLQRQSVTDGLTGLYLYSYLTDRLSQERSRAKRYGHPLECLFIDIDQFKALNDTHGHTLGNQVLAKVARVIQNSVRESDIVGRYGGDEFLVILPETNAKDACEMGERIRGRVEALSLEELPAPVHITVSIGVSASMSSDPLKSADQALRQVKNSGKNGVKLLPKAETESFQVPLRVEIESSQKSHESGGFNQGYDLDGFPEPLDCQAEMNVEKQSNPSATAPGGFNQDCDLSFRNRWMARLT